MSGPLPDATSRSQTAAIVPETTKAARPRGGPSLVFAIAVIGSAALLTAGGVVAFHAEPTQGATEQGPVASEEKPITVASLDPTDLIVPVRKVTVKPISAKVGAPPPAAPKAPQEVAEAAETDLLEQQDPRWARTDAEKGKTAFASVLQQTAAPDQSAIVTAAALSLADPLPAEAKDPSDETRTAAVDPADVKPKDVAKKKRSEPAASATQNDDLVPDLSSPGRGRTVQIIKGVHMRSHGKKGSKVLDTVPRGVDVKLLNCKDWCEIVYNGRRGFIYKDFIGDARGGSAEAAKPAKAKTVYTVDAAEGSDHKPETSAANDETSVAKDDGSAKDRSKQPFRVISSRYQ
ncbi:SH3 domain-containing protein [Mesorhizobium sp. BAC0120]|uniref:SH3 domain-containing protein n=1 Tax=Mesorhizobium sp. BAC0120 TaxID=3090670 RepID=UPI00298C8A25|nr:SH3 domain-containing protein [Mesorhizobium sp. BAC0120]MDW6025145.1 SH3 domain-containing protein [Mesorhizobium sp. BAC0120]